MRSSVLCVFGSALVATVVLTACGSKEEKKSDSGRGAAGSGNATQNQTDGSGSGADGNGDDSGDSDGSATTTTPAGPTTGCKFDINQTLGTTLDLKRSFKVGDDDIDLELNGPVSAIVAGSSKEAKLKVSLKIDKLTVKPALAKSFVTKLLGSGEIGGRTLTEDAWTKVVAGKKGGWGAAGCDMLPLKELVLPGDAKLVFDDDAAPVIPNPSPSGSWKQVKHPFKAKFSTPSQKATDVTGEVVVNRTGSSFAIEVLAKGDGGLNPITPVITIVAGEGKFKSVTFTIAVPDDPIKVELK